MTHTRYNKGVTAVEYGLVSGLIAIVIMAGVTLTGVNTKEVFCRVATTLSEAINIKGGRMWCFE